MNSLNLPRDIDAEKAIFSLILSSTDRLMEIVDLLKPSDFYGIYHQQIWQAMQDLFSLGQDVDVVSIRGQLTKAEKDVSPVMRTLVECYENPVAEGNLQYFVRTVKNKSILREIIRVTQAQGYSASLEEADALKVLQELEKDILDISDNTVDARAVDAEGISDAVNLDIQKVKDTGWAGYNTGFSTLDERTGGFIPTQTWIIGAYTGMGKTFLILQLLLNVLRNKGRVVLFSTEMDRKINVLRLIGNIAGLGTINMIRGKLMENEEEEFKKAQMEIKSFKDRLIIYDNVYSVSEIRLKAKKLKLTKGLDIIAVDFIQNLRGPESIYERMSEAAIGLQQIAQELNVTMLIGSQVSQASAGWQKKEAIEFKGAGEIAAVADVAIWLSRVGNSDSLRTLMLRKIRHGKRGQCDVELLFPSGRIIEQKDKKEVQGSEDDVQRQLAGD